MHETQNYQLSKIPSAYEKQFCFSFPNDLFSVQVSTKFDLKEELFRPAGPLHPPPPVLAHSWGTARPSPPPSSGSTRRTTLLHCTTSPSKRTTCVFYQTWLRLKPWSQGWKFLTKAVFTGGIYWYISSCQKQVSEIKMSETVRNYKNIFFLWIVLLIVSQMPLYSV